MTDILEAPWTPLLMDLAAVRGDMEAWAEKTCGHPYGAHLKDDLPPPHSEINRMKEMSWQNLQRRAGSRTATLSYLAVDVLSTTEAEAHRLQSRLLAMMAYALEWAEDLQRRYGDPGTNRKVRV